MFSSFKRLSISAQAAYALLAMLLSTVCAFAFWANDNAVRAELDHSRTVADMADSFRQVAARHGGFYIKRSASEDAEIVGRYLATYDAKADDGKDLVFHQKNPFLALSDYSDAVNNSPATAKFKMTSDNNFNPANQPDLFELSALSDMREKGITETWKIIDGEFRYARALRADKSCLTCHGSPSTAPKAVQAQYRAPLNSNFGGGYGYIEGSIVGATSVTVPHTSPLQMLTKQSLGFWISVVTVLGTMVMAYFMALNGVVRPLKQLSAYANLIANADDLVNVNGPVFDNDETSSKNEIHRESHALKSLHESMQAAMDHIKRGRGRT